MSKGLLIAFDDTEVALCGGFGNAVEGVSFETLLIEGEVPPADSAAAQLVEKCAGYTHIAAVSNMRSKDVMARLAGLLDAAMVSDVVKAHGPREFVRPMVAGSVLSTVEVLSEPVVMTFRSSGFRATEGSAATTVSLSGDGPTRRVSSSTGGTGGRPDLTQARRIVSGGRPLRDKETFEKVIGGLADKLGGAVGATRAAVDSGIAPNELQVGQTGKIVAPELYIAAGISGSTQHLAGMKDSKVIVAINTDPSAPIMEVADFSLVADLFVAVPEMTEKL